MRGKENVTTIYVADSSMGGVASLALIKFPLTLHNAGISDQHYSHPKLLSYCSGIHNAKVKLVKNNTPTTTIIYFSHYITIQYKFINFFDSTILVVIGNLKELLELN